MSAHTGTRAVTAALLAVGLLGCADAADLAEEPASAAASRSPERDGPGSGGRSDNSGRDARPAEPDASTRVRLRLPNVVGPRPVFLTPSRNIGCAISTDEVRCDIIERSYRLPRKPADCDADFGHSVSVGRKGTGTFVCVSDTVVDQAAPVLPYGSSTEVGDFGCTSTEQHIACYHLDSGHGFELSRESPALF